MKVVTGTPPNYKEILKVFPQLEKDKRVVFCYGDTIYAPGGARGITPDLEAHEAVHMRQQVYGWLGTGPKRWWKKYLKDPKFRLEQELEAYRAQYQFYKEVVSDDRNKVNALLLKIAGHLSGPIYGNLISTSEAVKLIKK